jgi:hypothetical protein
MNGVPSDVRVWAEVVRDAISGHELWDDLAREPFGIEVTDEGFSYVPPLGRLRALRNLILERLQSLASYPPPRGFEEAHEATLETLELCAEIPGYKLTILGSRTEAEWRALEGVDNTALTQELVGTLDERIAAVRAGWDRCQALTEAAVSFGGIGDDTGPRRRIQPQRRPIPDSVKMFVWQRDGGRCVRCGGNELLEFDHIIPHVRGGSDTARNLQLLCARCNRMKGSRLY